MAIWFNITSLALAIGGHKMTVGSGPSRATSV